MHESQFLELLQSHQGRLLRVAWAIVGQEADAWDVLQDAVEKAWLERRQLRGGPPAFGAWMRRIVTNTSLNHIRKHKRAVPTDPIDMPESEPSTASSPEEAVAADAIWDQLRALGDEQRQVVALRFLGDMSLVEISAELDVPLGTVKSRLNRALTRLSGALQQQRSVGQ